MRRDPERQLPPSMHTPRKGRGENTERRPWASQESPHHISDFGSGDLFLDFHCPEAWENELLLCKPPSQWYFAMADSRLRYHPIQNQKLQPRHLLPLLFYVLWLSYISSYLYLPCHLLTYLSYNSFIYYPYVLLSVQNISSLWTEIFVLFKAIFKVLKIVPDT